MKAKWRTLWALKTILIKSMALWHWSHCKFSRPNDNFLRLVHLGKFKCATNPLHSENAKRSPSFSKERGIIYWIYLLSWFGRSSVKNFAGVFIKFNLFRERVARRFDNLLHFFYPKLGLKLLCCSLVISCCWGPISPESQAVCRLFAVQVLRSIIFKHVLLCSPGPFRRLPKVSCSVHQQMRP